MNWQLKKGFRKKPELKKPILVEGLPGIGNVGKVVVDFIIDELKLKKLYEISSRNSAKIIGLLSRDGYSKLSCNMPSAKS